MAAAAKKKVATDWESVEKAYRAGVLSIREIGRQYGVSDRAIRKKADVLNWSRLLSYEIAASKVIISPVDEMLSTGFVYVIYIDSGEDRFYKIGLAKHFSSRFEHHQCSSPFDICVACCYFVGNMRAEEGHLHRLFADKRVRGEWFKLDGDDLRAIAARSLLVRHD